MTHRIVTAAACCALLGCKPIEPEGDGQVDLESPDSVSDLLDAYWFAFEGGDDARVGDITLAMERLIDEDALLASFQEGGQRRLTDAHLDEVALFAPPDDDGTWERPDPAKARPIFLVTRYTCAIDDLQAVLIAPDQDALYEGAYLTYDRTYTSSRGDFEAGTADTLTWDVTLFTTYFGAGDFTEDLKGGIRRVPLPEDTNGADFAADHLLMTRTWLPYPAARDNDALSFEQDYQLEIYVPWGDDEIIHLYGVWRELGTPFGDFEGDTVSRLTLTNLVAWDDRTEELCANGLP